MLRRSQNTGDKNIGSCCILENKLNAIESFGVVVVVKETRKEALMAEAKVSITPVAL